MSSFAGRMKEYPTVSLDRFDRENLHARAYFLSHCHKDHMKGLKGPLLKRKLKFSLTVKLYCSFVTKELLLSNPKYSFWEEHIVSIRHLDSPTGISLIDEKTGESEDVVVTLLPAGHCPGSVMFLFEGSQGTVLYTGDFRLAIGDVARMEFLHSGNRVKDIQSVYLDTTFFDPRYYQIPSREACLKGIKELVEDWICHSPNHVVWLNCKAAYGYEYLFTNLSQEFGCQIHVNSLQMFQKMPEILSHMTMDRATQIHACRHPKDEEMFRANRLPCGCLAKDGTPLKIISIKPSTMWFGERTRKTSVIVRMGGSSYRACFSFHSSYSEIKDFLTYICPVNIYPNVVPLCRTMEEVAELLKPMCREHCGRAEIVYKPLGVLKRTRENSLTHIHKHELFEELAMVPRRKKVIVAEEANAQGPDKPQQISSETLADYLPEPRPSVHSANYLDCTESNDDEDDGEQEPTETLPDDQTKKTSDVQEFHPPQPSGVASAGTLSHPPLWDTFFTPGSLPTDESSEPENSQNSLARSSVCTCSRSPELFTDEADECDSLRLSSSQSTHISEAEVELFSEADTVLLHPDSRAGQLGIQTNPESLGGTSETENMLHESQAGQGNVPDSQESSDFELPPTPGSKPPNPEELKELYIKLAAGEDLFLRQGSGVSLTSL
uniref:Protein artemis n=1 Tax=Denticeps clupeoides TaxID=299321 RepID=A0AAY4DJS7_9TELE